METIGVFFRSYYCVQIKGAMCPLYAFETKGEAEWWLQKIKPSYSNYTLEVKRRRLAPERRFKRLPKWLIESAQQGVHPTAGTRRQNSKSKSKASSAKSAGSPSGG